MCIKDKNEMMCRLFCSDLSKAFKVKTFPDVLIFVRTDVNSDRHLKLFQNLDFYSFYTGIAYT